VAKNVEQPENAGAIKNPDDWKTGDEPITGAQRSYLNTLATEAGEPVDDEELTKREASKLIDELQEKTGRGKQQEQAATPDRRR
jgi:hypothetical protein